MATTYTTPVGRLVQGDCYTPQPRRDAAGRPKVYPAGHINAGQPELQYFVAIAIPKNDPEWPAFRELLAAEARLAWPQFHDAAGVCTNPSFADKITDGDGRDDKGQPWANREGFAGHWVVKCASTFPPKVYEHTGIGWTETPKDKIKLGDYIRVNGTTTSNNSAQSPGMYVNLGMIAFDHEGARIVIGPTADQAFGTPGQPAPRPAAPSTTAPPPASGPVMLPAAGVTTYQAYRDAGWTDEQLVANGFMQAPAAQPPAPPAQPPAPPAPPVPPAPPAPPYDGYMKPPVMLPAAGVTTYQAYRDAGWTDEQLVANGFMQAPAA